LVLLSVTSVVLLAVLYAVAVLAALLGALGRASLDPPPQVRRA
jgi:hypothetical protein